MNPSEDEQLAIVAQREREAAAVNIEGLRQDAQRYRWLRKGDLESMRVIGLPQSESQYDRELDAEMKGKHHA
jgi:hypothetical protein